MSDQIKVVIRVRPLIQREESSQLQINWDVENDSVIKQIDNGNSKSSISSVYQFDKVFDSSSSNRYVYTEAVQPIVKSAMQGFNGTVFAYGQTSSGKTYTIMGCEEQWGVIPYTIAEIFETIENTPNREFLLRVSYMELYNEILTDLLSGQSKLKIKEAQNGDIFVADLKEEIVRSPEMIFSLLESGEGRRHFGETNMNDRSSRSHTIFKIVIESRELKNAEGDDQENSENGVVVVSHLNIVDLAGSERTGQMGATGDRFKEGCAINKSLSTLSQVISKLSDSSAGMNSSSCSNEMAYVNFRDSKLTRILQNSLGGNSKTAIICTVTPASIDETTSTLKFASRAKIIKNKPVKNEVLSDETMLRRCQKHINELKKQIHELTHTSNWKQEKDVLTKQLMEREERIAQLTRLFCISSKIVASPTPEAKIAARNRRITWCPGARNAINPLPLFSPIRYKRVESLFDITDQSSSFIRMDKETLLKELEKEEKEKIKAFEPILNEKSVDPFLMPRIPEVVEINVDNIETAVLVPVRQHCDMQCQTDDINVDTLETAVLVPVRQHCDIQCQTDDSNVVHLEAATPLPVRKISETQSQTDDVSLNSNSTDIQDLSNLCETLMAEKQLLERNLVASKNELTIVRADLEFVSKLYDDIQNQYEKLNQSYCKKGNQHSDSFVDFSQHEIASLQASLDEASKQMEKMTVSLESLTKQNANLVKERDDANKQCEDLFMDVWQANRKTANAEKEVKKCEAAINNLYDEIEQLKEQLKGKDAVVASSLHNAESQTDLINYQQLGDEFAHAESQTDLINYQQLGDEFAHAESQTDLINYQQLGNEFAHAESQTDLINDQRLGDEFAHAESQTDLNNYQQLGDEFAHAESQTDLINDQRLNDEIAYYKQLCSQLEARLNTTVEENLRNSVVVEHLRTGISDLNQVSREQLAQSEAAIAEQNEKIDNLKLQLNEFENRIKSLNESLQEAELKRVDALRRVNEYEEERIRLLDRATDAEHRLNLISLEMSQMESYKEKLLQKDNEIERLRRAKANIQKRHDEICDQADEEERLYKQNLAERQAEIDKLKAALEQQQKSTVNNSINDSYAKENEKLRAGVETLMQERHALKMKVAELTTNLELADEPWRRRESRLKKELDYKESRVQELKNELRRLEERCAEPTIQIPAAQQVSLRRTNSSALVCTTATGSGIMDDHKVFVLQTEVYQLTKTVTKLQKELAEAKSELETARSKVVEMENERKANLTVSSNLLTSHSSNRDKSQRAITPVKPPVSPMKKLNRVVSESPSSRSKKGDRENEKPPNCNQQ